MSGGCGIVNPYMNKRAGPGQAYEPTFHEHVANVTTHGIAILPSLYIAFQLVADSYRTLQFRVMMIYGSATFLLFFMSTTYHLCDLLFRPHKKTLRYYLHIIDRAVIYFFIAASSNPWLSLRHSELLGKNLKWIMWAVAFGGICYQFKFHERHKTFETCIYVTAASVPFVAMVTMNDRTGVPLMLLGGLIYATGVVFFKLDGIVPFAHAIWHCHVLVGASIHTYAVYTTLLGPNKLNPFPDVDFKSY